MKYKKIEVGPYNLHLIKTNKYKTINMRINFKRKVSNDDVALRYILSNILLESSFKYPNQRLLAIATEDLYNQKVSSNSRIAGKDCLLTFSTQFLNEKYTTNGMTEKSIQFFLQLIFNPDFENDKFKEQNLMKIKNKIIDQITENEKKPSLYAYRKIIKVMFEDGPNSLPQTGYVEDVKNVDISILTDYYRDIMHSDIVDVFVIGDIDYGDIEKIIKEYIPINTIKRVDTNSYIEHKKVRKRARKITEQFDSKQSQLIIGAKINKLSDFEKKYVWFIYNFILGGGPDSLLFKTVREKHSLCYSVSSKIKILSNLLIINAGIDSNNYEKTARLIRKEINNISKGQISELDVENAKNYLINSLKEVFDFPGLVINHHMEKEYYGIEEIDEQVKNIQKITKNDVIEFSKKVFVDTVFFLEGGE